MKLIREEVEEVRVLIQEDAKTKLKSYVIEGIFMQAEKQNRNGRVYPFATLNKEVERYNKEYVLRNRALGELGHPDNPSINLDRVSHMITSLRPDGNNFIGKAKILDTVQGRNVKGLLDGGVSLGVSTRGVGSLKPHNGYQLVQDDFKLASAADIVADPSAPDAFVQGIMEGKEWIYNNGLWKESEVYQAKNLMKNTSKTDIEAVAIKIFENFFSKM